MKTVTFGKNLKPHGRTLIRHQILKLLQDSPDFGITNLFADKPRPKYTEEFPLCLVYFVDEDNEERTQGPTLYKRTSRFVIEVQMDVNSAIDTYETDFLESRAYEIERILGKDTHLGLEIVEDSVMIAQRPIDIEYEGRVDVSGIQISWDVIWNDCLFEDNNADEFLEFSYKIEPVEPEGANTENIVIIREE